MRPGPDLPAFRVLSREEVTHIFFTAGTWERKQFVQLTVEQVGGIQLISPYAERLFHGRKPSALWSVAANDQC